MSNLSRRQLLTFFGAAAGTAVLAPFATRAARASTPFGPSFLGSGPVTPVRLPHNLSLYETQPSYLPTGLTTGTVGLNSGNLTSYTVFDGVIVAPEFESYVIVRWGDRVFPNSEEYFGYNCDYTAFRILASDLSEGLLAVNHEYVSFPISRGAPEAPSSLPTTVPTSFQPVVGFAIDVNNQLLRWGEFQYNQGLSIVKIRKDAAGRYQAVSGDTLNRRYHGLSGLALNALRTDLRPDGTAYSAITSWGTLSYQQGDNNYLIGTGPAATQVFSLSSDGLGNRIIGTAFNCSGAYTPWGTVLSAEENFQGGLGAFFVGVQENVLPNGVQTGYVAGTGASATFTDAVSGGTFLNYTTGTFFGQVGEKYGWMVEIDPGRLTPPTDADNANPTYFRGRKHSWLGRFRHENAAFRAESGKKLVVYMGDDRRGGHTWKFVSKGVYRDRSQFADDNTFRDTNSKLLEDGVLYVAQFNPPTTPGGTTGTGRWIPLSLFTQVNPIAPSALGSQEAAESGVAVGSVAGLILRLPRRNGVAGQTADGGPFNVTVANEATVIPSYRSRGGTITTRVAQLRDYYTNQGAILCDCYLAANLVGGTPGARPEDIEVSPLNPREVIVAYTDGAPGGDGYPDSRIFVIRKYTTAIADTQGFGGLYKIIEDSADSTGTTFRWERFLQSGEVGANDGDSFAALDNLSYDQDGNIWGVTDMSTGSHNGFGLTYSGAGLQPNQASISHASALNAASSLIGVYGNNWLFYVPVSGPNAGQVVPFAYGPPRCEITGPTFVGTTLILAVQHPSEDSPINDGTPNSTLNRDIEMLGLDGTLYTQNRTLPRGSNWPGTAPNDPPRPSVIGVRRKP